MAEQQVPPPPGMGSHVSERRPSLGERLLPSIFRRNTPETAARAREVATRDEQALVAVRSELAEQNKRSSIQNSELTPDAIPHESGFAGEEVRAAAFQKAIAQGLRSGGIIHAHYLTDDTITFIEQLMVKKGWEEVSRALSRGEIDFGSMKPNWDYPAIGYKLLADQYPNLALFGGGHGGVYDYFLGDLASALDAADPAKNPYKDKKRFPSELVMLPVADAADLYDQGFIDIRPEPRSPLWGPVMVVPLDLSYKHALQLKTTVWTPPSKTQRGTILEAFHAKAIQSAA